MSRAWRLNGTGIEALQLGSIGRSAPGPGQVALQMQAAAINHRDLGILAGVYPNPSGIIPFSDGAGVVEAVGPNVSGLEPGSGVITSFYPYWEGGPATAHNHRVSLGCEIDGVLAERVILPAEAVVAAPRTLSFEAAATLPCAGLTAWSALFSEGGLRAGEMVLIQGTGGVAIFALQLARIAGARAIVLSSDPAKAQRAESLGAALAIDYRRNPKWAGDVLEATGGEGVDLVVELGGQDTLPQSLECVKVGGRISIIGTLSGLVAPVSVPSILFRHIRLAGITVGHRGDLAALCRAIDVSGIKPVIEKAYPFGEAVSAYRDLALGRHFGKLVVTMAD